MHLLKCFDFCSALKRFGFAAYCNLRINDLKIDITNNQSLMMDNFIYYNAFLSGCSFI